LEAFLTINSAQTLARQYIDLFEIMIEEKRAGLLSQLWKPGAYVKPMDKIHAQLAIGPQSMNLQSSLTEGIFKTEKTKGLELQQGTDSR